MAIQDDNTVLCKGDLKAYHEQILPYLGGNLMLSTNVSDYYYTDETMVGVYTDGKPVYQRSYTFGNVEAGTQDSQGNITSVIVKSLNTWKIDKIVYVSGCATASNGNKIAIPYTQEAGKYAFTIGAVCWEASTEKIIFTNSSTYALSNVTVNVRYTKSTDTANSAITTPGAYDLNRPDLWPANQEIFFGNGLYGFRATGNMPALAAGTDWTNIRMLTNIGTSGKTFQMGGGLESLNANEVRAWTQLGISRSGNFESTLVVSTTGELQLGVRFPGTAHHSKTTNKYDVWVTYTK